MKKLFAVILICVLASFLFVGCLPVVPDEPEPLPTLIMSVDVDVAPHGSCADCICYSIENTGEVPVNYKVTFVVDFKPGSHTDIEVVVESEEELAVGDIFSECVKVICPNPSGCTMNPDEYEIDSISATYELLIVK